jgi:hypothetical protein
LTAETQKLAPWRLIAGILVLLGMAGILLALAPVYFEDYELGQYIRSLPRAGSAAAPDEALRSAVLTRSRQLDLPVEPSDIEFAYPGGKRQLQVKYAVQMEFPLYQVDLHFHHSASTR